MANGDSLTTKLKENIVYVVLGLMATSFGVGWGAHVTLLKTTGQEVILTEHRKDLESCENQLTELKAKQPTPVTNQGGSPPVTHSQVSVTVPDYTRAVNTFLASASDPQDDYQWNGYRSDVDKLHSLIDGFLDYLDRHPETTYAQAQTFYPAIEEAATVVMLNAQYKFELAREQAVTEPPPYDLKIPNYNQKLFVGPGWFRIRVEELKREHKRGLSGRLISDFRNKFNQWRADVGI